MAEKKKGFFKKLIDRLDRKMEEKSKESCGCCCDENSENDGSCCK